MTCYTLSMDMCMSPADLVDDKLTDDVEEETSILTSLDPRD